MEPLDLKGIPDPLDSQARPDPQVRLDFPEKMVRQVLRVPRVTRANLVRSELQVHLGIRVLPVRRAVQGRLALKAHLVKTVHLELPAVLAHRGTLDQLAREERKESLVQLAI